MISKSILREPLLHFLLIGLALFVVFRLVNDGIPGRSDNKVIVSAGRVEQLEKIFTRTWHRQPTTAELQGLVDDFVLEEIYYRQAVAMGIDRDDTVIRRRLRQKFEFLTDDMAAAYTPSAAELAKYFAAHASKFKTGPTYSFEQIYINPDKPGAEKRVANLLEHLRAGLPAGSASGLLPASFEVTSARTVAATFGQEFAESLDELAIGEWQGPIKSGLGLHIVRLTARAEGSLPKLADVRPAVEREWVNEKRLETRRLINEQLLKEYEVVIEWPPH